MEFCLAAISQLYGCYRKDDAADPKIFVPAAAAVLSEYPKDIVEYITDPRTSSILKTLKWPPSIAELVEAADKEVERRVIQKRYLAHLEAKKGEPQPKNVATIQRTPEEDAAMAARFQALLKELRSNKS